MSEAFVRELTVQREGQVLIDGLPLRAGDQVEVVVIRRTQTNGTHARYPLHGQPLTYDRPFDPACDPDDWEADA